MGEAEATQWLRGNGWRQGSVLPNDAVDEFGLGIPEDRERVRVVVISHDCDLANDVTKEPFVEVIIGRLIDREDGNSSWGKSSRTLHYTVDCAGSKECIELVSPNKAQIDKECLARFSPDDRYSINHECLALLRNWLAARYRRPSFPDAFNDRMKETGAAEKLAKVLAKNGTNISFVFFDLRDKRNVECDEGDSYPLTVVLAFRPGDNPEVSADEAETVAETVEKAIRSKLPDGCGIELRDCFAMSEDEITVRNAKLLDVWDLDYVSFRSGSADPAQPMG